MIPILSARRHWVCPNCPTEDWTTDPRLTNRFHTCIGLHGLTAPLLPDGLRAKVEAVERGDYIGTETAGPYMAVQTTRDDGQDVAVFAPTAKAGVKET